MKLEAVLYCKLQTQRCTTVKRIGHFDQHDLVYLIFLRGYNKTAYNYGDHRNNSDTEMA